MKILLEKAYSIDNYRLRKIVFHLIRKMEGGYFYEETSRKLLKKYHDIELGYGTAGFIDLSKMARGVVFGNYCGISANVYRFNANHPPKYFTTHAFLFNPIFGCTKEDVLPRTKLIVGHDVWLGAGSIILPSVSSIGNGAIVAAGAVVVKNVDRYTIVGGNPAKKIGERFTPDVIDKLEQSKWWLLSRDDLKRNKTKFEKIVSFSIEDLIKQKNSTR